MRSLWRGEKGQSLVEFALILPLLLLLLFGTIEFGRVFSASLVITNAAREGARLGAVGKTDAQITQSVKDMCSPPLDGGALDIEVRPAEGVRAPGGEVTVTVGYGVSLVTPVLSGIAPNPFPLNAKATMRVE
ncbi:TadE/TadG family type IV pilus assembly protein [Desulforudis sp. 1088]|uniref:TadE/TadG family type IV pilus assembly protein n=1 Tax=unclassified Candidatus Desulforudis TaxID=2635950 RepID=UPI00348801D1